MKLVIIEPLGVEKEKLLALAEEKLEGKVEIVYYDTRVTDTETLIERAKDADILAFSNLPFKKEVLEHCDNLKMISVAFTGVDHVAMDYCRERGILVSNCAGYSNTAVPELVFGMVLNLYRYIIECNQAVREGKDKTGLVGQELEGKKFGIIGMGAIGTRTAQLARAFGCEVYLYFDLPEDAFVMHYMGEPTQTRHIVVRNEEAVISPSWSIHSGSGSRAYTFIWGMVGENQDFDDMDGVKMTELM